MANGQSRRQTSLAQRLSMSRDRSGSVAIYVALIISVTFGVVGLAIDASRAMIVQSESQAAADAAALAAASQLDGTPTSITRANAAIANLVSNMQRMATEADGPVGIAQVRYLSGLPGDDASPIGSGLVTTNPLEARFVEVTTTPLTHTNTFLLAVGAASTALVTTRAVAGCHQMVCRTLPMMICNPAEATSTGAPFDIDTWAGRQVVMFHQGNGGSWAPGNFGYLEISEPGANALRESLARVNGTDTCYGTDVTTEPGAKNGARNGLNVRFGIYQNPGFGGGSASSNPLYAPDVNVRAMPQDLSFTNTPGGRFGNGHWNCLTYWNANHGGSGVARPAACTASTSNYMRYDMYQYEIANGLDLRAPANWANELPDRRIIYVAVVNCEAEGLSGRMTVGSINFLRIFLTEPVNEPSGVTIYGEIVDVVQLGQDDAVLHDIVQLYR
jgi:Flp pilus assembly protein TadG